MNPLWNSAPATPSAIGSLVEVSARLGTNRQLVQAGTGNTSLKRDGTLWIKASGRWLADAARDQIFLPLDLEETLRKIDAGIDPSLNAQTPMRASVETAMHAVIPYPVVFHVHSVNAIAWAVRQDGATELARRLDGVAWQWVPYTASGLRLADAVKTALAESHARVLILANHGLVVSGDDCDETEALLCEVERRIGVPARVASEPAWPLLERLSCESGWQLPDVEAIHTLGTDSASHRMIRGGILYPCQLIFLTAYARSLRAGEAENEIHAAHDPFLIIEGAGTLLHGALSPTQLAILSGLAEILLRIPEFSTIRYLSVEEVRDLQSAIVYTIPAAARSRATVGT